MASKCECRKRHRFLFQSPTVANSAAGAPVETFATVFSEYGYFDAKNPYDLVQSEKPLGNLMYDLEVRWNPNTQTITNKFRVVIATMGNITLQVMGPISPMAGDRRKGLVKAVQTSPLT
jgi:hypothetical protein